MRLTHCIVALLGAAAGQDRAADGTVPLARPGGFAVLDLTGYWQINPQVTLRAGIMNLADRSYFEWSDVRARAADDPLLEQCRRPGRHGSVSVTVTFQGSRRLDEARAFPRVSQETPAAPHATAVGDSPATRNVNQ